MSVDQVLAVLAAVTGLVVAFGVVLQRIESLRRTMNGQLKELLEAREAAAMKTGELRGRDHAAGQLGS